MKLSQAEFDDLFECYSDVNNIEQLPSETIRGDMLFLLNIIKEQLQGGK